MSRVRRQASVVTVALALGLAIASVACAQAQTPAAPVAPNATTISGRITDRRGLPIIGAVIAASGTTTGWTATVADGRYVLKIPPGSYDLLVRKGGYTPGTISVVVGAAAKSASLELGEANLNSVNVGSANSGSGVPFNTGVSALATLSDTAISRRPELTLNNLATELAGVTLAHPSAAVPDMSFVVRGGTVETRVQIDGHAVSAGATGRWNGSYASPPLFDSIEVVKGAGISGADAGESAFGTINLRTRDFRPGRKADVTFGTDGYAGSFSMLTLAGNLLPNDRLSYMFEHNLYGYNGPNRGQNVYNALAEPGGAALIEGRTTLNSPLMLGSDLAKVRWRFSGNTSLTFGYLGIHADYGQAGGAYGLFEGSRTIVASAPGPNSTTQRSAPQYPGLVGQTLPIYSLSPNTTVQTNQPLFEAELRTAIQNNTLLIRPYGGTIFNLLDGSNRNAGPDPSQGYAWTAVTTGGGCTVTEPCYTPGSSNAYRSQEVDRLYGTTVTLIHPAGDSSFNLSFDYRSDGTTVASGDPTVPFVSGGPISSLGGYAVTLPTTLARNIDWSATYMVPLTSRLRLFVGNYYTDWKLSYGVIRTQMNYLTSTATESTQMANRTYRHDDPHVGLTWHPERDTNYRFSLGSAITVPYAALVSGGPNITGAFTLTGTLAAKNPDLEPETTVAYNAGLDHRLPDGTVIAADVFSNTVYNVFATQVAPFNGAPYGLPAAIGKIVPTATQPVNAPLERSYGLELSVAHSPAWGMGYHLATTFQRAYLSRLPASFFSSVSSLLNEKQLDGATSIPFTQTYGELNYRSRSGLEGALGANYTGSNNWTNGPAFMVFSSILRYDFKGGYRAQLSIENLFDTSTGTRIPPASQTGAFRPFNTAFRLPAGYPAMVQRRRPDLQSRHGSFGFKSRPTSATDPGKRPYDRPRFKPTPE